MLVTPVWLPAGEDPESELNDLVDTYMAAVEAIGETEAKAGLELYEQLDRYKEFVRLAVELQEQRIRTEDYMYDAGETSAESYMQILDKRLAAEEKYSADWINIMRERERVQQDIDDAAEEEAEKVQEREEKADRGIRNRFKVGQLDVAFYIDFLKQKLAAYDMYSDEWTDIFEEIQDLEESEADRMRDFADEVRDAFRDVADSVRNPILEATSLISAFGDQANVTRAQVEGFYAHQREGTQRWVNALKALKDMGANGALMQSLIAQGPQSLGFAESLVGMGSGGLDFINGAMADIANISNGFAEDYARSTIGTVQQMNQTISLRVDNIDITLDTEGTDITMGDVRTAIEDALREVSNELAAGAPV
jgi:hypothetical protein